MNFDSAFDHPPPVASMTPEDFRRFCEWVISMNPHLSSETCMVTRDDERWMAEPFSLTRRPSETSGRAS